VTVTEESTRAVPDGSELPMIVSVDDHIVEPPDLWERWLPSRFRDRAPRVERRGIAGLDFTGGTTYEIVYDDDAPPADCWIYEDLVVPHKRHVPAVGFDMLANHVDVSLSFPTFPRFCGQTFLEARDRELAAACVVAYNDFMVEEWCGDSGGHLVPLIIVPLWDPQLAAAEVRRNAARGCHAVCFSEVVAHLGLPSIHTGHWDPFFAACAETDTVVCMHIGSSSRMPSTSPDAPPAVQATLSFGNAMSSLSDYLFSGVLVRFPELRLAYSEGQIGWLPYILERADDVWREHRAWGGVAEAIPEPPSTYYYRQVFGCFFRDRHGLDSLEQVGVDNITFETDYPHTDSTWPDSARVAQELMGHLPADVQYKILRGNAIRMLSLDIV